MKKTLNKILSTIFRTTLVAVMLVCTQSVWGDQIKPEDIYEDGRRPWFGHGNWKEPDILDTDLTKNISTSKILIRNYITVGKGRTLKITNNTNAPVYIKNNWDYGVVSNQEMSYMFYVRNGGTLIIEGKPNAPIIIDGGANFGVPTDMKSNFTTSAKASGNSETGYRPLNYGGIRTEGTVILKNVIIQNMDIQNESGSALKIGLDEESGQMGKTTLENCTIRWCRSNKGPALFGTGFEKAQNTTGPSCAISLTDVLIEKCYAKGDGNWAGIIRFSGGARSDLNLTRCTMRYNYAVNGCAGVFWNAGGKKEMSQLPICTIDGCDFHYNETEQEGGAIRIETNMQFVNNVTTVHNNKAKTLGGGIHIYGYNGGADRVTGTEYTYELSEYLKIYDNTAGTQGGGIGFQFTKDADLPSGCKVNVNFNGVEIYNNKVLNEGLGGGLYFTNTTTATQNYDIHINLNKGLIADNTAGNGGGIYIDNANINSSSDIGNILTIKNNKAITAGAATDNFTGGGGLYLKEGNITLNAVEFINNTAGKWGRGGGVNVVQGTLTLNSGLFDNNSTAYGGGIYVNKGILHLNRGTIKNNKATESGGGICAAEGSEIYSSNEAGDEIYIEGNEAQKGHGGGIAVRGAITMNKVYIRDNKALSTDVNASGLAMGCGGGIFISGTEKEKVYLTLNSGDIERNQANMGGGIYLQNGSIETGTDEIVNIKNNTALQMGGGILLNSGNATMNEVHFHENKASVQDGMDGYGGGLFVYGGNLTLNSGDFIKNEADYGGGIYVRDGHIYTGTKITDIVTIEENSAAEDGGGIYLQGGDMELNTVNIIKNTAWRNGGGLGVTAGGITIKSGEIRENKASNYGGGLYLENTETTEHLATFSGGTFYKNTADNAGGAVAMAGNIYLTISCVIDGNSAPCGGGVFMRDGARLLFKDGLIRNNTAVGMPTGLTTAYQLSADELQGVGGGIFMGNKTTLNFSTEDNAVGLYNNRADFAADDLFANKLETETNLPMVRSMNLRDYDAPTTRLYWVEDYPIGDTKYEEFGTNLKHAGDTIRRYQESLRQMKEVYILDDAKLADYKNTYLCLTLGYELVFLRLTKQGLAPFDDATFLFYYTNKAGQELLFREVLVTGSPDGKPVTTTVVLPSGYWRVVESTWSSLYEPNPVFQPQPLQNSETDPNTGEIVPAGYHLFDNKKHNSLLVINQQKQIDIREAEHRKVNRIKPL